MNKATRDTYFDFMRGIAIMLVVANHTKGYPDIHNVLGLIDDALQCVVTPAVPIFLAISGYFLSKKVIETRTDYFLFLRKQLPTVYLPCLFWSIFYSILSLRNGNSPKSAIVMTFTCRSCFAYYFIIGIMQCYVLLPLVRRINRMGVCVLLFIALAWIGSFIYIFFVQGHPLSLTCIAAPFPNLLVWFALGCYLGQEGRTSYRVLPIAVATIIAFIFSCAESQYIYSLCEVRDHDWKITAYLFDFCVILLVFSQPVRSLYHENRFTRLISRLGIASFAIYLTHILLRRLVLKIFPFAGISWISRWATLLIASWIFVETLKKFIPTKIWRYLGLR